MKYSVCLAIALCLQPPGADAPGSPKKHTNRLARETSPYLLQHAHNPVDWYPWGEEAFARARAEDKPVLLSVGYSACHWCHVMERESFEDPEIAALMNRHFVCVKVDREERPDVDQIYMQAVQSMTGHGGWPMTVFLTPEGEPFYGGTYFPPVERHGLPGFPRLLQALAEAWANRRGEVTASARQIGEALTQADRLRSSTQLLTDEILFGAFQALSAQFDEREGGLGGAPKFPQPMIWEFVLRFWRRSKNARARQMVHTTLTMMARGGIYDQVGVASTATPWTRTGSCRTSRRCSTTTVSSPRSTSTAGSPSAIASAGASPRRRSTTSFAR